MKQETFIYWKWKDSKTYFYSYIQKLVEVTDGTLLELTDSTWFSSNPTRVLLKDIDVLIPTKP